MTAFQAKDAKAALAIIGRVIERRNTIPILGNVMIKASGEKMTISGTVSCGLLFVDQCRKGWSWITETP